MLRRFLSLKEMDESTSLYHYTKCQSAQAILNGHSFYATNTQFLNDVNEMQYILSVVDEIIMEMDKPMWSGILKHLIMENIEEFHKYEYYLISFSTKPDSLTLWAEFGDKTGYNVEFNGMELRNLIKVNQEIFCDGYVIYNREHQKRILQQLIMDKIPQELHRSLGSVIEAMRVGINEPFEEYKYNLQKALAQYALFFKQPEYASEKEYRFVFREPESKVHFREQNGFLLPYIVLNCPVDERLPVRSVTVAPKNHTDLARRGMEYYLRSLGYEVPVKLSRLKLRY